jgi:membrane-associated protease RseP (regulator of RpoE activity)
MPSGNLSYVTTGQPLNFTWIDDASRNSGMTLAVTDAAIRAHLSLGKTGGLIVTAVDPDCPAVAAGVQANDVLVRLDLGGERSAPLSKPDDLEKALKAAGERPVSLVLFRGGKEMKIKIQPRLNASLGPVPSQTPDSLGYWIGVQATTVEPALKAQLRLPQDQGLIIGEVYKDSPAARAGIQVHDIFLRMDDVPMTDTVALTKHVQSRADKPSKIELLRGGRKREIDVTPEPRKTMSGVIDMLPKIAEFDVVLPGAVLSDLATQNEKKGLESAITGQVAQNQKLIEQVVRQLDALKQGETNAGKDQKVGLAPSVGAQGPQSIERRLDELSGQIKDLQAAIEALAKASAKK